jgi:hypothetical protein
MAGSEVEQVDACPPWTTGAEMTLSSFSIFPDPQVGHSAFSPDDRMSSSAFLSQALQWYS